MATLELVMSEDGEGEAGGTVHRPPPNNAELAELGLASHEQLIVEEHELRDMAITGDMRAMGLEEVGVQAHLPEVVAEEPDGEEEDPGEGEGDEAVHGNVVELGEGEEAGHRDLIDLGEEEEEIPVDGQLRVVRVQSLQPQAREEEEEEVATPSAFEFEGCVECEEVACVRPVKEICGHVKCRRCFVSSEEEGCRQCVALPPDNQDLESVEEEQGELEEEEELEEVEERLVIGPNEYVFELAKNGEGSRALAVVSKETLKEFGIDNFDEEEEEEVDNDPPEVPDGDEEQHQENGEEEEEAGNHPPVAPEDEEEQLQENGEEEETGTADPPASPLPPQLDPIPMDTSPAPPEPEEIASPSPNAGGRRLRPRNNVNSKPAKGNRKRRLNAAHIQRLGGTGGEKDPKYQCGVCQKQFSHEYQRKYHTYCNTANGPRPFKCTHCPEEFVSQSHCQYHVRSRHTGEKPYECPVCSARFIQKVKLNRHLLTHTSPKAAIEAAYLCAYCQRRFTTLSSCRRHISSHTAAKPFSCPTCGKGVKNKYALQVHERTHQNIRPFKCPSCPQAFSTAKDLRRHHLCHTGELPFLCNFGGTCTTRFRRKDNLERHFKKRHNVSEKVAKLMGIEAAKRYIAENPNSKILDYVRPKMKDRSRGKIAAIKKLVTQRNRKT